MTADRPGDDTTQDRALVSADEKKPGATASFPFDRMTVERFREAFPHARWRDDLKAWFVPGKTAERRIDRWLGRELAETSGFADERGRDDFAFDPIDSPYLKAGVDLQIATPYSRTIVAELRQVPWAWWDPETTSWRVPYRSLEHLRVRWPAIEDAARLNEPEARRQRRAALAGEDHYTRLGEQSRERQRHRYPVSPLMLPLLGRVVMTPGFGTVIFTAVTGELVDPSVHTKFYASVGMGGEDLVWAEWRRPTLAELVKTWPSKTPPSQDEATRGWWQPTLEELRDARRKQRSVERAQATRRRTRTRP